MNKPPVLRLTEHDYIALCRAISKEINNIQVEIIINMHASNSGRYYLIENNSAYLFGEMMRLIEIKLSMHRLVGPINLAKHGLF